MSEPVGDVAYVRIHPDTTWHAPGREDQPGATPASSVFPAVDLFPSDTLTPGG